MRGPRRCGIPVLVSDLPLPMILSHRCHTRSSPSIALNDLVVTQYIICLSKHRVAADAWLACCCPALHLPFAVGVSFFGPSSDDSFHQL